MEEGEGLPRMYRDLAWTWPIISSPESYEEESEVFARAIKRRAGGRVRTLLHLGCGGGHNDLYLKRHFAVTGVDLSEGMLANAKRLNPELEYLRGDMRRLDLGRTFDAVAVLDSVSYMLTEDDLRAVFRTSWRHLRPGGVLLTYAELTKERFSQNRVDHHMGELDGTTVVLFENEFDPDPDDTTMEYTTVYLIRRGREVRVESERQVLGLFQHRTWTSLLEETGFEVEERVLPLGQEEHDREIPVFVCRRP